MDLPTNISLTAQLRTIVARGDFYTIIHRGDADTGLVILKWRMRQTLSLYTQERDFEDGVLKWRQIEIRHPREGGDPGKKINWIPASAGMTPLVPDSLDESAIDAYITRAVARDPDVWVVEIETQTGDFPLEGKII